MITQGDFQLWIGEAPSIHNASSELPENGNLSGISEKSNDSGSPQNSNSSELSCNDSGLLQNTKNKILYGPLQSIAQYGPTQNSVSSISGLPPSSNLYGPPYALTHNDAPIGTNVLYGPLQNSAPLLSGLPQSSIHYGPPHNATQYGYRTQSSTPYGPPQSSRLPQADSSSNLVETVRFTVWLRIRLRVKFYKDQDIKSWRGVQ